METPLYATHTYMTETVTGWTNSISACPKPWVWNSFLSLVWMCHSVIGRNLFAFSSTLQQLLTEFRLTGEGSIYSAALRQTHRRLDKDRLSACVCAESEKKMKIICLKVLWLDSALKHITCVSSNEKRMFQTKTLKKRICSLWTYRRV